MIIAHVIKRKRLVCLRRSRRAARVESVSLDRRVVISPELFDFLLLFFPLLPEDDFRFVRSPLFFLAVSDDGLEEGTRRFRRTFRRTG